MSSIKKSASFRSRIPVRRTKPIPRRCYSPPALSSAASPISNNKQQRSISAQTRKGHYRIWSHRSQAPLSKCATYSSSSYSSGDESQESETPIQAKVISARYRICNLDIVRQGIGRVHRGEGGGATARWGHWRYKIVICSL